jgi:hypothetical protein
MCAAMPDPEKTYQYNQARRFEYYDRAISAGAAVG